jgi:predicted membrane protein
MIPLPAAVAISQVAGLLGVEATRYIVMAIAYFINDIDFRLMYEQDVFQKARYFKRFSTTKIKKNVVLCFSAIALVIYFLPTLVSIQGNVLGTEYSYSEVLRSYPYRIEPSRNDIVFKELINTKSKGVVNTTAAIIKNHFATSNMSTNANPSGVWYNVDENFAYTERWESDESYPPVPQTINAEGAIIATTFNDRNIVTYYYSKQFESSSTLEQCLDRTDPAYSNNMITNFSNIEKHRVQAVHAYSHTCYPITDNSLLLSQAVYEKTVDNEARSKIELNDAIFRSSFIHEHTSASVSVDASSMYLDNESISMLIKKKAHITAFYDNSSSVLCRTPSNHARDILPYNQDIDSIVCQLTDLALQNPTLPMLQATRRNIENNKVIDSVYTYIKKPEGGHGIMIDLISVSAFLIKKKDGWLDRNEREVLIAHQTIKREEWDLTGSNYHNLLQKMDVFPSVDTTYGQNTWADLVQLIYVFPGLSDKDHPIYLVEANVTPTLAMPSLWLIVSCVLFVVFAVIIAISSMMTSAIYKANLRKLLLSTLQYSLKAKSTNNRVSEDGAIEMNDINNGQAIVPDHNGKIDNLYASVFKYGVENKDKNQLLTMDDIPIVVVRTNVDDHHGEPEEV